jgi:hypothetical protein
MQQPDVLRETLYGKSFAFRAAYLLALELAKSGCGGSRPADNVLHLFNEAYARFSDLEKETG